MSDTRTSHSLLSKSKATSTTQSAHQTTIGGATANQSHANKSSQPPSIYDDPNTPYPPGHYLAPEGDDDQYGGYGANDSPTNTCAALIAGGDITSKSGRPTETGKKH